MRRGVSRRHGAQHTLRSGKDPPRVDHPEVHSREGHKTEDSAQAIATEPLWVLKVCLGPGEGEDEEGDEEKKHADEKGHGADVEHVDCVVVGDASEEDHGTQNRLEPEEENVRRKHSDAEDLRWELFN